MPGETQPRKRKSPWRKVALIAAIGAVLCLFLIAGSSVAVKLSAVGLTYGDTAAIPHRRVGLLLGCAKILHGGRLNQFFRYRIEAAAELYQAGKVDCLLVSGDNHTAGYNECRDMKESLVRSGVPAGKITCDFAGLRTLDSVVRAKAIFGQTKLTVISQKFHNERAIFIAKRHGMDAIGFNARMPGSFHGFQNLCREQLSRVKALMDEYLLDTQPKFLGEPVHIGDES